MERARYKDDEMVWNIQKPDKGESSDVRRASVRL